MIFSFHRQEVVKNIEDKAEKGKFHEPVEINDPTLSNQESNDLVAHYWQEKKKPYHKLINRLLLPLFAFAGHILPPRTSVVYHIKKLPKSAFVTSNHFNDLDILIVKKVAMKQQRRLYFLVKDSNLIYHFPIGQLVRNVDSIPVARSSKYLGKKLPKLMKKVLDQNNWILIYPEQEMWFNYRKPRPFAKGAYFYAAKLNKPIISCFVEMQDCKQKELFNRNFHKTKYIMHVLDIIEPDPKLSTKENMKQMRQKDYELKKRAYEKIYGKKLTYKFEADDIAGYIKKR